MREEDEIHSKLMEPGISTRTIDAIPYTACANSQGSHDFLYLTKEEDGIRELEDLLSHLPLLCFQSLSGH